MKNYCMMIRVSVFYRVCAASLQYTAINLADNSQVFIIDILHLEDAGNMFVIFSVALSLGDRADT